MKKLILLLGMLATNFAYSAGDVKLLHAEVDTDDYASLQTGARLYMNYCVACHSLKYMRYNRMAADLQLSEKEVKDNLMFVPSKPTDFILNNMNGKDAEAWFGKQPPDLSLVGRSRGKDWLYSYLVSFYQDGNKATGVNNLIFKDVGMPHVLAPLQGKQILSESGKLEQIEGSGSMTDEEYRKSILHLVNFLTYVGEPIVNYRSSIGIYVIAFLLLLLVLVYALKKEFWRDID